MKRIFNLKSITAVMSVLMLLGVSGTFAQKKKPVLKKKPVTKKVIVKPAEPMFSVDSGTVIRVRMNNTINSKTATVGQKFTTTVTEPVYSSNGVVVIPTGSIVTGQVNSVKQASKGGNPGELDCSFTSVRLPNGRTRTINASLTDLTSGKTTSDNEGGASGSKMKNRKIIFIGGGAAGGAVLGAMIGGGKATAIGAAIGAGAGILGEMILKGPDAEVKSGTEFGLLLNQAITLPRFAEATTPVQ